MRLNQFNQRKWRERGMAVLLVMLLVSVMGMLMSDHGLVLHQVRQELKQVERRQEQAREQRWKRLSAVSGKGEAGPQRAVAAR